MLTVLSVEVLLLVVIGGVGLIVRGAFGLRALSVDDCLLSFWMGFAGILLFLLAWNFVFPVNAVAALFCTALGAAGVLASRCELAQLFSRGRKQVPVLSVLALLVVGLWMATVSVGPQANWDSQLYHIQGVKWANAYAVVPGLANLYGPLGFNNTSLLYDALLNTGPLRGYAYHVANGVLILALLIQVFAGAIRFPRAEGAARLQHLFDFMLMLPAATLMNPDVIVSYVTDPPATLLLLVAFSQLYRFLVSERPVSREEAYQVFSITALLAAAVCVKLSVAVFAGVCWLLVLMLWTRRAWERTRRQWGKAVRWSVAATLMLALLWASRGVMLSGYPLFPLPLAGFPVEWRAPVEHAQAEHAYIVHSGRVTAFSFGEEPDLERFSKWFPRWLHRLYRVPFEVLVPLFIALASVAASTSHLLRAAPIERRRISAGWWILFPILPALAFWFVSAPEPRYATHLVWGLALLCFVQAFAKLSSERNQQIAVRATVAGCLLLGAGQIVVSPAWRAFLTAGNPAEAARRDTFYGMKLLAENLKDPASSVFLPALEEPQALATFTTATGIPLNVPVRNGGRCMDAPLPCTPNPSPNLRLRWDGHTDRGFAVDGTWQMQDWPYDYVPHFLPAWRALQSRSVKTMRTGP